MAPVSRLAETKRLILRSWTSCCKITPRLVAKKGVVKCRLEMEPDREVWGAVEGWGEDAGWASPGGEFVRRGPRRSR